MHDVADNVALSKTKLAMPVLAIGGEKSFGDNMAIVMRNAATNVRGEVNDAPAVHQQRQQGLGKKEHALDVHRKKRVELRFGGGGKVRHAVNKRDACPRPLLRLDPAPLDHRRPLGHIVADSLREFGRRAAHRLKAQPG